MITICVLNLTKALVMIFIWAWRKRQYPLQQELSKEHIYTLGDAVSSFMRINSPQLILSIMYIFINAMLSTFLVQREFSRMFLQRKPLRVSEPLGFQRASFFISLPLKYGIPLYGSSALMHWLISQSLFLARITALRPDGTADAKNSFSTCGASPIAVVIITWGVVDITDGVGKCAITTAAEFKKPEEGVLYR
ncbi:hypothetical protein SLS62_005462 [Diatrype stigma]|uniref:Uncharacterized protein n=1 Tax=Diatrype stigma TaxID=117547 RepID=A0AAN9YSG1_9PEZI